MTFEKPQVKIIQKLELTPNLVEPFLPSILLAPRYDVLEKEQIGSYIGSDSINYDYEYPERSALSTVDLDYVKLFMQLLVLKYYDTDGYSHKWRKVGSAPNKLRTIIADGIRVKTDNEELYPHDVIFKDRGVFVGDAIKINVGGKEIETIVAGFEADKSISLIEPAQMDAGNSTAQSNSIGAANSGIGNSGNVSAVVNVSGTYTGSLYEDVIEDVVTVRVIQSGGKPVLVVLSEDSATIVANLNEIYNFSAPETYTITIVTGGAPGVATYIVTSSSGTDNEAVQVTPALADPMKDIGTRGVQFQLTGSGTFTTGETIVISCDPSSAKLQVTTQSGTGQITAIVFPGFDAAINIGRGVEITLSVAAQPNLVLGDYWVSTLTKEIEILVGTSAGTFDGDVDTNYIGEIIQGGEFGQAVVRISSTFTDGGGMFVIQGSGPSNSIDAGKYGVTFYFDSNTQNGLVKGDKISIQAKAAKETAIQTIITQSSIFEEADEATINLPVYTGSNPSPNTASSSGEMKPSNRALELYDKEIFTITVTFAGTYGVAKYTITSSTGLNNDLTPVLIPVTPGTSIELSETGVIISFTGGNDFELTDSWTVEVTKPNLSIELGIKKAEEEIPRMRVNDATQTAWEPKVNNITVNAVLQLIDTTWSEIESLPISSGILMLTYRALHSIGAEDVITVNTLEDIIEKLGVDHKDNPASRGARFALDNSQERPINVIYPGSDTTAGWASLLEKLEVRTKSEVYRLCVLTCDADIISQVVTHIDKMSGKNKWRMGYISRSMPDRFDIIGTRNSSLYTATVVEDNANLGVYSIMRTTNANFELTKVGDTIVYLGNNYLVKIKRTPSEIEIDPPLSAPQTVSATIYVYHIPTATELAEMYAFYGNSYKNRKIALIGPGEFIGYGEIHPMFYATAAIGGLLNSLPPHQGISNYNLVGVSQVHESLFIFSDDDLDIMANGGVTVIAQDSLTEVPYIRHQVTTDPEFLKLRERSINENLDSISYGILDLFTPYIGKYNLHIGIVEQLRTNLEGYLYKLTENKSDTAGPQITGYEVILLKLADNAEDTLEVKVNVDLPAPFNRAEIEITA